MGPQSSRTKASCLIVEAAQAKYATSADPSMSMRSRRVSGARNGLVANATRSTAALRNRRETIASGTLSISRGDSSVETSAYSQAPAAAAIVNTRTPVVPAGSSCWRVRSPAFMPLRS